MNSYGQLLPPLCVPQFISLNCSEETDPPYCCQLWAPSMTHLPLLCVAAASSSYLSTLLDLTYLMPFSHLELLKTEMIWKELKCEAQAVAAKATPLILGPHHCRRCARICDIGGDRVYIKALLATATCDRDSRVNYFQATERDIGRARRAKVNSDTARKIAAVVSSSGRRLQMARKMTSTVSSNDRRSQMTRIADSSGRSRRS